MRPHRPEARGIVRLTPHNREIGFDERIDRTVWPLILTPEAKYTFVQLATVNSAECEEAISEIHLAGRRVPNAWCQDRPKTFGPGDPSQHHEVGINYFFSVAPLEIKAVGQVQLTGKPVASESVGHRFIRKNKNSFLGSTIHFQAVVWFEPSGDGANLQSTHFDFRSAAG